MRGWSPRRYATAPPKKARITSARFETSSSHWSECPKKVRKTTFNTTIVKSPRSAAVTTDLGAAEEGKDHECEIRDLFEPLERVPEEGPQDDVQHNDRQVAQKRCGHDREQAEVDESRHSPHRRTEHAQRRLARDGPRSLTGPVGAFERGAHQSPETCLRGSA